MMKKRIEMVRIGIISLLLGTAAAAAEAPRPAVSVLYFTNTAGSASHTWLERGLADMLITGLSGYAGFMVVEREALDKVMREQALALSGAVNDEQALEVGRLVRAGRMVSGSYIVSGKKVRIDAKVTDTETGVIAGTAKAEGKLKELFALGDSLAVQLLKVLAPHTAPAPRIPETTSPEAFQSYYEGVMYLEKGETAQAVEKFTRARDLDPLYLRPARGLEDAYRFLEDFTRLRQQREIVALYRFAEQLNERLAASRWITYAELLQDAGYAAMSPGQQAAFNDGHAAYVQCSTPAQCAWRLGITLYEIGDKTWRYFGDGGTRDTLYRRVVSMGDDARERYADDPFLAEILGFRITVLSLLQEYAAVKEAAEEFMTAYPDYRMIESVENAYRNALDALKEN